MNIRPDESISSQEHIELIDYRDKLVEKVHEEASTIELLLQSPPQTMLVHVYGISETPEGTFEPNTEGHYCIRAVVEFIAKARQINPA